MSRKNKSYSEEFKLSVIRDYYSSGMSKSACRKKYGLSSPQLLISWLRKYGSDGKSLPLQPESTEEEMANRSKDSYKEENAQLKKLLRELEKALEFSRLEPMARDMMTDKAEEYFDIPIRKKLGPSSDGTGQRARHESRACLTVIWPLSSGLLPVEGRH